MPICHHNMYKNMQTNAAKTPDTQTEVPSKVLKVPFSIILIYSGVADLGKVTLLHQLQSHRV